MGYVGTGTVVAIFKIAGSLFAVFLPVMPSLGTYVASHLAVDEESVAIVAPWSSEIHLGDAVVGSETTTMEDVAVGLILGR